LDDKQLDEMERQEHARHYSSEYTYMDHYGFLNGTWSKLLGQAREANRLRVQVATLRGARDEITRIIDEIDAAMTPEQSENER
jgi:hypothetical protein